MNTLIHAPRANRHGAHRPSMDDGPLSRRRDALADFSASGGVIGGDELTRLLRSTSDQPISLLAHWIVSREVLMLNIDSENYLPKFQFDFDDMTVRPGIREVIAELRAPFDDWELAQWFTRTNNWLDGRSPAEAIAANPADVLQAARAGRFVAMG
jgi:hypothetical protein